MLNNPNASVTFTLLQASSGDAAASQKLQKLAEVISAAILDMGYFPVMFGKHEIGQLTWCRIEGANAVHSLVVVGQLTDTRLWGNTGMSYSNILKHCFLIEAWLARPKETNAR